ncbi:hypothetical protein CSOJ01_04475 [Colletotrichum sojae]|uniref:Uncharacterized protein n=1 Tax=Colletotrichum sojae TaxID=2175907 RepID=A0A8H6JID3_9PEZI|nr:hypothetical protein CSOJ01_04475 [Colletotrichum sojae]
MQMPCHGQGEAHVERAQWALCIRMPSSSAEPVPGASSPWVTVGSQPRAELSLCRPYHNAQAGLSELIRRRDPTSSAQDEMRSEEQPRGVVWAATDSHHQSSISRPGGRRWCGGAALSNGLLAPLLEIRVLERHRVPTSDHISNERRSKAAQVRPSPDTPITRHAQGDKTLSAYRSALPSPQHHPAFGSSGQSKGTLQIRAEPVSRDTVRR